MTLTQSQSDKRYEKKVRDKLHAQLRAEIEERRNGERVTNDFPSRRDAAGQRKQAGHPLTFAPWWVA